MSSRTYGQVNYDAFCGASFKSVGTLPAWVTLSKEGQELWESAAWTVIGAYQARHGSREIQDTEPEVINWNVLAIGETDPSEVGAESQIKDSKGRKATR